MPERRRDYVLVLRLKRPMPDARLVAGWTGNVNVKWLRPSRYGSAISDAHGRRGQPTLTLDGKARQLQFVMEAKSVITFPSGSQQLPGPGFYEIRGLVWSGRGLVRRVEVSTDGGKTWRDAGLQAPVLRFAHTRFRLDWRWDGREAVLQSRCTDETGYLQPTLAKLVRVRGLNSLYLTTPSRAGRWRPTGASTYPCVGWGGRRGLARSSPWPAFRPVAAQLPTYGVGHSPTVKEVKANRQVLTEGARLASRALW